jgi:hypothetical protein
VKKRRKNMKEQKRWKRKTEKEKKSVVYLMALCNLHSLCSVEWIAINDELGRREWL